MTREREELLNLRSRTEKLERENEALLQEIIVSEVDRKNAEKKYNDLYKSCRATNKKIGIIIHLEHMLDMYINLFEKLNTHYTEYMRKWGRFYEEYEQKQETQKKKR